MFFELRTYDLKPGKAPVYLEFFRSFGLSRVTRHLPLMGYWMVESGRLNRIEHLWAYESFAERDDCRAGLVRDREWMEDFVPRAFVDVVAQANRFLALDTGSPAFDAAVAARTANHGDQPPGSAMFAPGLMALTCGAPTPGDLVAAFTVLSGEMPGARVALSSGPFEALTAGTAGADSHEILRPLSLSPLK